MFCVEAAMLRCRIGTRLGRPVLPLVCRTSAISSGEGAAAFFPAGAPAIRTKPVSSISSE